MLADGTTLAVLIPTHNRPEHLRDLIASVEGEGVDEIIVFDDCSDPPVVMPRGVEIRLIRSDGPALLSKARNALALAATADVLIMVDDDCTFAPGAVAALAEPLSGSEGLAMTGPVITYRDAPEEIWCAGIRRGRWTGRTLFLGRGHPYDPHARPAVSEEFPSVFAVTRASFLRVGGFDELRYPMHMSEADLGVRYRSAGYTIELRPAARVMHDIPSRDSLARRLHLPSEDRALMVSRERLRFLRTAPMTRLRRCVQIVFWFVALSPAQIVTILGNRHDPLPQRLRQARGFLRGLVQGSVRNLPARGTLTDDARSCD